jgi:hypothetical protein
VVLHGPRSEHFGIRKSAPEEAEMHLSTYVAQEFHAQRVAELERNAAVWRQLPPRRARPRRLRFSFPLHRRHPRLDVPACR